MRPTSVVALLASTVFPPPSITLLYHRLVPTIRTVSDPLWFALLLLYPDRLVHPAALRTFDVLQPPSPSHLSTHLWMCAPLAEDPEAPVPADDDPFVSDSEDQDSRGSGSSTTSCDV